MLLRLLHRVAKARSRRRARHRIAEVGQPHHQADRQEDWVPTKAAGADAIDSAKGPGKKLQSHRASERVLRVWKVAVSARRPAGPIWCHWG